jgi:hypothetical protein
MESSTREQFRRKRPRLLSLAGEYSGSAMLKIVG